MSKRRSMGFMAGLFVILGLSLSAVFHRKRKLAITLLCVGFLLAMILFIYHMTDALKINS